VNGISGVTFWLYVFEDAIEIMCGNMNFKHYVSTCFFFPVDFLGLLLISPVIVLHKNKVLELSLQLTFFFLRYE